MATDTSTGHLRLVTIDGEQVAPPPRRARGRTKRNLREIYVMMAEEHNLAIQKALLAAVHSLEAQRRYIRDLKALDGFNEAAPDISALVADMPLFRENELRVVPKGAQ